MAQRKLPWVMVSDDATKTARFLIDHAGGVQAAHDAVSRAAKELRRKQGRPAANDLHWLLIADAIRRHDGCSDTKALELAAHLASDDVGAATMVRRLRRKLSCKSLADFAQAQPMRAVRRGPRQFAFEI